MLKSGVHAALAGVALALAIPLNGNPAEDPPLTRVEHELAPWVAFGILPLFGFANSGLSFAELPPSSLLEPVPLAIAAGLSLGKQIGVFGSAALVIGRGWAEMPNSASWAALYGTSILTGIGFTMSLFIGTLAFGESNYEATRGASRFGAFRDRWGSSARFHSPRGRISSAVTITTRVREIIRAALHAKPDRCRARAAMSGVVKGRSIGTAPWVERGCAGC